MHMKLIMVRITAAWALLLGPALGENDGYCYDAEQHPIKFSDLGSRLDITQALNKTCEAPVGDQMYACNAAVSTQTCTAGGTKKDKCYILSQHRSIPDNYPFR